MSEIRTEEQEEADGIAALLEHPDIAALKAKMEARQSAATEMDEGTRRAAVALIFRAGESGSPELLFIKRAEYPGDPWSGQIAFPGGREEVGDANLAQTAIRETREETGLDLQRNALILGALNDLRPQTVRLPAIMVRPYVLLIGACPRLSLSDEVALAFWIPLDALKHQESWQEMAVQARGVEMNRRAFLHEGHIIWGMTERIVAQLLALLEECGEVS
jgi:8-oxo-dGTP pyrophosphatase MutT (NUDIX family)